MSESNTKPGGAPARVAAVRAEWLTGIPVEPPPFLERPTTMSVIVVEVETEDGRVGQGMTANPIPMGVVNFVNSQVSPALSGTPVWGHEVPWRRLYQLFNQRAHTGVWMNASSAIDIALWDLRAQLAGVPLASLLGGSRTATDCYVTFGLDSYDTDGLVAAAKYWVAAGHTRLKMKVGMTTVDDDVERVGAVRDAVGPAIELMVDANRLLYFHDALRRCDAFTPFDLAWFEEPLLENDERLLADLRRQTNIPLAVGQHEPTRQRFRDMIERHSIDVVQLSVPNCGGFTESVKIATLADTYRLPVANGGGWPYHNLHLQAGVPNGTSVELLQPHIALYGAICDRLPEAADGTLPVPDEPGLGFRIDSAAIAEYRHAP